jgi:hypothetical protein
MSNLQDLINNIENNLKDYRDRIELKTLTKHNNDLEPIIKQIEEEIKNLKIYNKSLGFDPDTHRTKYLKYKLKYLKLLV